jgi:signal transduction histidine kinase
MSEVAGPRRLRELLDAVLVLGSDLEAPSMLRRIVSAAATLVDARYGALGVLDEAGTGLAQFVTVGMDDEQQARIGDRPEGLGLLGVLIVDAQPLRLPDLRDHPESHGFPANHPPMRSFLGVPLRVRGQVFGNLYLTDKTSAEAFTDVDEELVVGLATAAGIAIENIRLQNRVQELALVEDRERIARDLHDTVIQRLFASGLSLEGTARLVRIDPEQAVARIASLVDELDLTVKHIRSAIFALETTRAPSGGGLRDRVLALAGESAGPLGFRPSCVFDGPVDTAVDEHLASELLATLREALSNVVRHAEATKVEILLTAHDGLRLQVADDGIGPPSATAPRGQGLKNMEARAARQGGHFELRPGAAVGTVLEWRVPFGGR